MKGPIMQTNNRFLDDLAKVANGAASTVVGLREEIEALGRQRLERLIAKMDLVPRDEFEAVKAVAAKARAEQEKLEKRLADLEARLDRGTRAKARKRAKPSPKTTPKPRRRPAAKK